MHKGSIAVDGISLTVAGLGADRFDVQVIPYTLRAHEPAAARRSAIASTSNATWSGKYVVRAAELAGLTLTRPAGVT